MPVSGGASSGTPTHDQLDELEALMQRMLELPVDQSEADLLLEDTSAKQDRPHKNPGGKESVARSLPLVAGGQEFQGLDETEEREVIADPRHGTPDASLSAEHPLQTSVVSSDSLLPIPDHASSGRFHPLLWINAVFEWITRPFGSTGAWLRSDAGRNVLGILGIAAAVWSLVWLVWGLMSWNW
jgi:hypothetical protein